MQQLNVFDRTYVYKSTEVRQNLIGLWSSNIDKTNVETELNQQW